MDSKPSTIVASDSAAPRGRRAAGCAVGAHSLHPAFQSSAAASVSASPASSTDPAITTARRSDAAAHARAASAASATPPCTVTRRPCASARSAMRVRVLGALRVGRGGEHVRRDRGDLSDDSGGVLVGEHAEHDAPLVEVERFAQRRDQRTRAVRIVRGVHEHRGRGADQLQAAGRRRAAEALREDVAGDRAAIRRRRATPPRRWRGPR